MEKVADLSLVLVIHSATAARSPSERFAPCWRIFPFFKEAKIARGVIVDIIVRPGANDAPESLWQALQLAKKIFFAVESLKLLRRVAFEFLSDYPVNFSLMFGFIRKAKMIMKSIIAKSRLVLRIKS